MDGHPGQQQALQRLGTPKRLGAPAEASRIGGGGSRSGTPGPGAGGRSTPTGVTRAGTPLSWAGTAAGEGLDASALEGGGAGGSKDRAVRVAVRLRPPLRVTWDRDPKGLVELDPVSNSVVAADSANRLQPAPAFQFDSVFGKDADQVDVYTSCVAPLVSRFLAGYNATVMAYGQTGSGKTHTMGREDQQGDQLGMLQRTIRDVFNAAAAMQVGDAAEVELRVQFVEIYNEEVRDLLDPTFDHRLIRISERPDGAIVMEGVLQEPVTADGFGAARALDLFLLGCQSRVVGTTNLNLRSSRAHAIYTLLLTRRPAAEPGVTYSSKLHVVDLAGSERCKRTKAEGTRMREAISINSGLLVLQKVMAALQVNSRRGGDGKDHVPYRESKLTRMLQDSLGGNAYICIIACVSGEPADMEETLLTLKYAAGARRIKGAPTITKKVTAERQVQQLQQRLLALLERSAAAVQSSGGSVGGVAAGSTAGLKLLRQLPEEAVWQMLLDLRLQLDGSSDAGSVAGGSVLGSEGGGRLTPRTCAAFAAQLQEHLQGERDGAFEEPDADGCCSSPTQQQHATSVPAAQRGSVGMSLGTWLGPVGAGGPGGGGSGGASAPATGDIRFAPRGTLSSGDTADGSGGFSLPQMREVASPQAFDAQDDAHDGSAPPPLVDGGVLDGCDGDPVGPRVRRARDPMRCSTAALSAFQPPFSHCPPLTDVAEDDGEYYTTPVPTPKASPGQQLPIACVLARGGAGAEARDWSELTFSERMAVLERCYGGGSNTAEQEERGEGQQQQQQPLVPLEPTQPQPSAAAAQQQSPADMPQQQKHEPVQQTQKRQEPERGQQELEHEQQQQQLPQQLPSLEETPSQEQPTQPREPELAPVPSQSQHEPQTQLQDISAAQPQQEQEEQAVLAAPGPTIAVAKAASLPLSRDAWLDQSRLPKAPSAGAVAAAQGVAASGAAAGRPASRISGSPSGSRADMLALGAPAGGSEPLRRLASAPSNQSRVPVLAADAPLIAHALPTGVQPLAPVRPRTLPATRGGAGAAATALPQQPQAETPPGGLRPASRPGTPGAAAQERGGGSAQSTPAKRGEAGIGGGRTWAPSAWAAGALAQAQGQTTPSRIPGLRSPLMAASPTQLPEAGARGGVQQLRSQVPSLQLQAVLQAHAQGAAAEGPPAAAPEAATTAQVASAPQDAPAVKVGAEALRRPMSFTSLGGLMGWAAAAEGPKPDSSCCGTPATSTSLEPPSPLASEAAAAATGAGAEACVPPAGAFHRLLGSHLDLVCGNGGDTLPGARSALNSTCATGSPAASSAALDASPLAGTPATGTPGGSGGGSGAARALAAGGQHLPLPLLAQGRRAKPSAGSAAGSASAVHPLPCDDEASVTLSWSDLEDDDDGCDGGGGRKGPGGRGADQRRAPIRGAGGAAAALEQGAAKSLLRGESLASNGSSGRLGIVTGAGGMVVGAMSSPSSASPGRVEDLISRINAALDNQQAEAVLIGGQEGQAQAAQAERMRHQAAQALQVLSRPGAAARSISHVSSGSSGSGASGAYGDGPTITMLGGVTSSRKLRSSQRLAAKLASRLRAGGSAASSQAGGSQAGGSQAGDRPAAAAAAAAVVAAAAAAGSESGSDGEGTRDTRGGSADRSSAAAAAAIVRHGPWLSSATREELAKMTKAASRQLRSGAGADGGGAGPGIGDGGAAAGGAARSIPSAPGAAQLAGRGAGSTARRG